MNARVILMLFFMSLSVLIFNHYKDDITKSVSVMTNHTDILNQMFEDNPTGAGE